MINSGLDRLRQIFLEKNLNALLISNFHNIYYLTGFQTLTENERESWLLITNEECYLFTDGRYFSKLTMSNEELAIKTRLIEAGNGLLKQVGEILDKKRITSLAVEADDLKLSEYLKIKSSFPNTNLVTTEKLIIKLRETKTQDETEKIKTACEIGDQCLSDICKTIKVGQTEKEIATKIEFWLKHKNHNSAFAPIVAIDKNSAIPHYDCREENSEITSSSVILIDFGVEYKNYCSDITRMIFFNPGTEVINIYNILLNAQQETIKQIENNHNPGEIDGFCRSYLRNEHLSDYPHSTGHGIGLEVHEYPKISPHSTDIINNHQVFTIEPGVYLREKYGLRIEDTVLVKENGVEILTNFSKEMIVKK